MKRKHGFRELTSALHLYTAAAEQTPILVFQDGELIGSGPISEITDIAVVIREEYYVRSSCTFTYTE